MLFLYYTHVTVKKPYLLTYLLPYAADLIKVRTLLLFKIRQINTNSVLPTTHVVTLSL